MKAVATFAVILLPSVSCAQSHCAGQTQIDATFCAKEKWEIADKELNRLWKEVKSAADKRGNGEALLNEQRAWLKRRDATCDPELKSDGSAAQMFYWSCMEEQTLNRNQELSALR
ncbi:lysozyme inhibitor LprI family protein [Ruegeria arenilitoris]|uniref:lysozyme inhibitor LprI family protein n=1 Tax=Ruegeria arenilitoris TaxID=1173585 RepID=UPI00147AE8ED|nr:lysozyme inhibitor LprI family protein [Ruegeria arenilitoris]